MKKKIIKKNTKVEKKRTNLFDDPLFKRSLFYAISVFAVFQLALAPLQALSYIFFWCIAFLGFVIVFAELLFSSAREYHRKISFDVLQPRKKIVLEKVLHHLVMPSILYISGILFVFFNHIRVLDQMTIIILTICFFVLFYNISATYTKLYSITRTTKYIYAVMNIVVFYFFMDALINGIFYSGINQIFIGVGSFLVTLLLVGMMILAARQFSKSIIIALIVSCLIIGAITIGVLHVPFFNIAVISLVVTVVFFLVNSYWHHKLEGSFSWDVMHQYFLFAIMAFILLLYL